MTDADIDRMERALEARLRPWRSRASALIDREMGAALAHAAKSLTGSLKATEDGRRSARRIEASPSFDAAKGHLWGLLASLAGPSRDSLDGLVRDARASFYGDSVALWKPWIEPEYLAVPDPRPTRDGEALMRGAIVHGYDLDRELRPTFAAATSQLFVTLNVAGRKAATDRIGRDRLGLWHRRATAAIKAKAFQVLSDSDKAVHEATAILLLHPRYRPELDNPAGDGGLHFQG